MEAKLAAEAKAINTYEIIDGVRRAKAAELLNKSTIPANIIRDGKIIQTTDVPINSLLSPKEKILMTNNVHLDRWFRTYNQTKAGSIPPPIDIQVGTVGTPISKVGFEAFDDF